LSSAPVNHPASLVAVLAVTFLGSVSGGAFWAAIFFVSAQRYGFSPVRNLVLGTLMGALYALAARLAGPLLRRLDTHLTPRACLAVTLALWGAAALAPLLFPRGELVLWATALCGAVASAVTWPIVESYLGAGRHGRGMRGAIGWFNVTWTPAVAVPLLLMPLLARIDVLWTIALSAVVNTLAIVALAALPARPAVHERDAALAAVGGEYAWLLRSASWLLPFSYLMCSTLAPILPHRLAQVSASAGAGALIPGSVVAATWMVARFVVLLAMWRTGFWHGRWGTLAAAGAALVGGTALVLLGSTLAVVVGGLALFGAGMGLTYYAALYYSLAVGHAAVDAGGNFEALIGVGYCLGPLLGLTAHASAGRASSASATVAITFLAVAAVAYPVLRPYLEARRGRRR
jgi:hypothetical protein